LKSLVFFATGSGTNFQSVIDEIHQKDEAIQIRGLITNNPDAGALSRAKNHNIPAKILNPSSFNDMKDYEAALLQALQRWQPDLIVLAGYLLKIPASIIEQYPGQIINIHPSLLPKYGGKGFYGIRVHEAVLDAKETETGCSVHFVDEEYDRGPILAQRCVPVQESDTPETLAKRVLKQEHTLLTEAIRDFFKNESKSNTNDRREFTTTGKTS
jgi:formyltetrahydrofolate-dependent phosphoribosylglycinamide formyltransferase